MSDDLDAGGWCCGSIRRRHSWSEHSAEAVTGTVTGQDSDRIVDVIEQLFYLICDDTELLIENVTTEQSVLLC